MTQRAVQVPGRQPDSAPLPEAEPKPKPNGSEPAPASSDPLWTMTALGDLGPNLPTGIVADGRRSKLFRFRPYRMKEEKQLGEIRDKTKGMSMGQLVNEVLGLMVQTVGPHTFDTLSPVEKRLIIGSMIMTDALYMYVYLRHEAMYGEPLELTVNCPFCRSQSTLPGDLQTLEIRQMAPEIIDLRRSYRLRDGITVKGDRRFGLTLAPMSWAVFDNQAFQGGSNTGARDAAIIQASVVAVEGIPIDPFRLSDPELDELTKYDFEGLVADIELHTPGPQMVVTTECGSCRRSLRQMINWEYDAFFKRASRSSHGKA